MPSYWRKYRRGQEYFLSSLGAFRIRRVELRMIGNALILHKKGETFDINEVLNILVSEGDIELAEITFNEKEPEHVPTLEELHRVLANVSVPIEKIIREEREKRDDILYSNQR